MASEGRSSGEGKGGKRGHRRLHRGRIDPSHRSGAQAVRLSQILPGATFFVSDDIVAAGCSDDPDACGPGDIFVARLTASGDGHDDVARALARGVAGVVAERMIPTFGTPLCLVPDSGWAMARLCHALAGDPARRMRVVAVTGTSGKTTTAWLTAAVLAEAGLRVGVLSDLGCIDADAAEPEAADLESPRELAAWFGRLAAGGCTHAVVEVSSTMLAQHALAGVACDAVVVTSLASAHLDVHGTAAAYRNVKARILDCLAPDGCLVANQDDDRVRRLVDRRRAEAPQAGILTVGLTAAADITAVPVERSLSGQTCLIRSGSQAMPLAVSTPIASFVRDGLLAAAVGTWFRVPLVRIARGLEAAGAVPGRVERIDRGQDYAAFVDHPTSGHALASALAGLRRLTPGKLVVLAEEGAVERLAAGAGREEAVLGDFSRRIARWADDCLVVPATLLDDDGSAADLAAYARVDRLLSKMSPEDCLLVLGDEKGGRRRPGGPDGGPPSLVEVVDGWLQLAHVPAVLEAGRRAA